MLFLCRVKARHEAAFALKCLLTEVFHKAVGLKEEGVEEIRTGPNFEDIFNLLERSISGGEMNKCEGILNVAPC